MRLDESRQVTPEDCFDSANEIVLLSVGLLQQYKAHVLCILEGSACAIYHAAQPHLSTLDELQRRFVRKLGLDESEAFLRKGGLAPLELRRDIAVLGFLHKIQLGDVHPDLHGLFPRYIEPATAPTRRAARRHARQFREQSGNSFYFKQSLFGALTVYNFLPTYAVETTTVKAFQTLLTRDARLQPIQRVERFRVQDRTNLRACLVHDSSNLIFHG